MKFIGEIFPVDGYFVILSEELPENYMKALTHLYQPLIGIHAIALYQTLVNEIDIQENASIQTHHTLMNYLNLPLNELYKARLQLEGIGLLKTFENKREENNYYTYELQSPFAPNEFFKDAMLSELLYHHIGKSKYQLLRRHYLKKVTRNEGTEITASFKDVFQTFKPSLGHSEQIIKKKKEVNKHVDMIDFSWMEIVLKQRMIPAEQVLTKENKKLISEMTFLYNLDTIDVEKAILWALTDENKLDAEEFRSACHDVYKKSEHHDTIELVAKNPINIPDKQEENIQLTREEQLLRQFESISPKQLLEDLSSGNQASDRELKMISDIMVKQGLPAPVMNVLIHYVLIQSNMKLSKAYLETIASHWSRAGLKTAQEAMNFAKTEIRKFQKNESRRTNYRKQTSKEVIPEWFKNRKNQTNNNEKADPQAEKKRQELADLIKEFANED